MMDHRSGKVRKGVGKEDSETIRNVKWTKIATGVSKLIKYF